MIQERRATDPQPAPTDTPTPLLHPKTMAHNVTAWRGNGILETVNVRGDIHRARAIGEILACKYGFGPLAIDMATSSLEHHRSLGNGGIEIEDMDPGDPWEFGPWDEQTTAEMSGPIGD